MIRNTFWNIGNSAAPSACLFALLAGIAIYTHAQNPPNCNALVSANNQLFLVSQTGSVFNQFVTDSLPKESVALSPDGSKVAYISSANPNAFTVVDTSGRSVTTLVPPSTRATFTSVSWDAKTVLNVRSRIGQENDLFQFYSVPNAFTAPLAQTTSPRIGKICAARGLDDNNAACISENLVVVGKKILESQDSLSSENVKTIATLSIPIGSTVTSQTTPSFQARVVSIADDITLQITLPNGNWSQSRVPLGAAIPISWDDGQFGFIPVSVDSVRGAVTVNIVKSNVTGEVFDPAITWTNDNYVAAIERGSKGAQYVLTKSSGNTAPIRSDLGIQEQVISMTYDTPTLVVFRTASRFAVAPVTFVNGGAPTMTIGPITTLPTSLVAQFPNGAVKTQVVGWSCR